MTLEEFYQECLNPGPPRPQRVDVVVPWVSASMRVFQDHRGDYFLQSRSYAVWDWSRVHPGSKPVRLSDRQNTYPWEKSPHTLDAELAAYEKVRQERREAEALLKKG